MEKKIIKNLTTQGCLLEEHPDENGLSFQCDKFAIHLNPFIGTRVIMPFSNINHVKTQLDTAGLPVTRIEIGEIKRGKQNSKIYSFNVSDEFKLVTQPNTLSYRYNKQFPSLSKIKTFNQFFNKDLPHIRIEKTIVNEINRTSSQMTDLIGTKLSEIFTNEDVICDTFPDIQKYWTNGGNSISWELNTYCHAPSVTDNVREVLDDNLQRRQVKQDHHYISSYFSPDGDLFVNKVTLSNIPSDYPYLEFTIHDERILEDNDIIERLTLLKNTLNNNRKRPTVNFDTFTKYLQ